MALRVDIRVRRRGFSLLELLVVIAILMLVLLVFGAFFGQAMVGPSLDRHRAAIMGMAAGLRQEAAIRQVHTELVFDYRLDQVNALSRRRLTTFAFESAVGSGDIPGQPSGGARIVESRMLMLRDGKALELPDARATFTIPWMPTFDVGGDYEGMALSFDFFPMDSTRPGNIAVLGNAFTVEVAEVRGNAVRLALRSMEASAVSSTWIAMYRWATVEIAVSRYSVSLYVDGRLDAAELLSAFQPAPPTGSELRLGGFPCRIDNLDLLALTGGGLLELAGSHLIAWGIAPVLEVNMQTKHIYEPDYRPSGPVTGPGADTDITPPATGLPRVPPPPVVHVHFDSTGRLDAARHAGAAEIYLVEGPADNPRRLILTFHPLGSVTYEFVESFPWEQDGARR
jgi:prepilin-type N-terminal cleavage/methylation domain-containing protein